MVYLLRNRVATDIESHLYAVVGTTSLCSLETSTFEELGSEFINFACNCVINTLRLIVYLTVFSI